MTTQVKDQIIPELRDEKIGERISEELSHYLKKYLGSVERGLIAHKTGVGFHTVDKLIQGYNSLTKANYVAIVEAVNMAIDKSDDELNDAKIANKKLKKILKAN